ncbi:hypothetical protein QGP82_23745 [Leptothoe sp. LEGE 181152]|nr:hypothetical protein [Leptothoe sp. LEGE 181152]
MIDKHLLQHILQVQQRMEKKLDAIHQLQTQLLAGHQSDGPMLIQWLKPKDAAIEWNLSESTLRKYRYKEWTDGSYCWLKGVHWKSRVGYNHAIVDHWFTYRHDHKTHQDYIHRWLKATNQLPNS